MALCNTPIVSGDSRTREVRERTLIRATKIGDRIAEQEIIIRNANAHGIGAVTRGTMPEPSEALIITLPDGQELSGRVCWVADKTFGVQLDDVLDLRLLKLTNQRRNEDFAKTIDWMLDLTFREAESEQEAQPSNLRHL